jgi:uracil phosphoribosyltransferase
MRDPSIIRLTHPLVQHHLTRLRDTETSPEQFRALVNRLSILLAYEASQDLKLSRTHVRTPLARAKAHRLGQRIGLVPILRAGLGMVDPILDLVPEAEVWHLGFYRDEQTLRPVEYYKKLPHGRPVDVAYVLDPMLATGGSAVAALQAVKDWGVRKARLLSIIAAPEGLKVVRSLFPKVPVYVCAIDDHLNRNGFIVPGLGDAGDRTFNAPAH